MPILEQAWTWVNLKAAEERDELFCLTRGVVGSPRIVEQGEIRR